MSRIVSITLRGRDHELRLAEGETIFAAALRAGLDPPFSCLAGYCGSCIAQLEEGTVQMRINTTLTPRQVARGLILCCQAVPETARCCVRLLEREPAA